MTKDEAAIISAYTQIMIGSFSKFHEYAQKLMGRPIYTHEFASKKLCDEISRRAKHDFLRLHYSITDSDL